MLVDLTSLSLQDWMSTKPRHPNLLKDALRSQAVSEKSLALLLSCILFLFNLPFNVAVSHANIQSSSLVKSHTSSGFLCQTKDGGHAWKNPKFVICDAVAVAKILNATLVIPLLEVNPVWKDSSSFEEIFDVDHFIDALKDDISIVKELPYEYSWSTREFYATAIRETRVKTAPVHASVNWYIDNVLPIIKGYGIAAISPFSHRLAFDNMPMDLQRLRCKVNFQALIFVPHIRALGDALVKRLRYPSPQSGEHEGASLLQEVTERNHLQKPHKFVVLHLRFDKDMAAHSACDFGGGKAEKLSLAKYRQAVWQGRVLNSQFTDEELRSQGRCPLTPEEVGLLLAALGFDNSTCLYLASHKGLNGQLYLGALSRSVARFAIAMDLFLVWVYGGEARLSNLRKLFPLMEDKKSLASTEERARIKGKASLLAAVDYYVSMHSDIFISASPGNMHNALVGHRTYESLKTIRPNMPLLGPLFLNKNMSWMDFRQAVVEGHQHRHGQLRLRKPKQSIYTYPAPDCMCRA
ncbi:hypothetical protein Cgig2_007369 [Carnegiea gigantea]|uniref:O-fucosyltransferase family protein n=1 Tax=Carnegiea gigantea TaxID=171969 RepID=A0A9Q1KVY4_9CARY|nr:hypothetical protein Cgig2_007369 [Carnegiea gigantea]